MERIVARHSEWLQIFKENFEENDVPTPTDATRKFFCRIRNSSAKEAGLGKQNIDTHVTKDQNCKIFARTKITRVLATQRTGKAIPWAENLGDLTTANHKVPSEGFETHHSHRHAFVVQDLASRWMDWSMSVQNEKFNWNEKEFNEVLEAIGKAWSHLHWKFPDIWQSLWRIILETPRDYTSSYREKRHYWKNSTDNQRSCSAVLLKSGLDEKWWADSMECWCYLRDRADRFVRREDNFWSAILWTFQRSGISFRPNSRMSPNFCQRPLTSTSSSIREEKCCPESSSDLFSTPVEFGKETWWLLFERRILERRHLGSRLWGVGNLGRGRNPCSNTQCEGGDDAGRWSQNHTPGGRWTSNATWRRSSSENTTSLQDLPEGAPGELVAGTSCKRRSARRPSWRIRWVSAIATHFRVKVITLNQKIQFDVPKSTSRLITNGLGRNSPPVRVHFTAWAWKEVDIEEIASEILVLWHSTVRITRTCLRMMEDPMSGTSSIRSAEAR